MCFHSVRSACWQSHECNQGLCVLHPCQKPQFKVCSTCRPSPGCAFYFCTSEQESLWVSSDFAALLLQSLQHQSSLLLNFLPLGNQLIHIILFVQLSSHCLRIQLPHLQRAFAAHHVLGHRSPPRHSRATDYSLPSCTFSARHLWVTVIFGRGFQVVFLHFAALLLQSLEYQSSLFAYLPSTRQSTHSCLPFRPAF